MRIANIQPTALPLHTQPIETTVPFSIDELNNQIRALPQEQRLNLHIAYATDYTASFRLSKRMSGLFCVEMTGSLVERGEALTIISGQVRVSPLTYAATVLFALLALLTLPTAAAALFALLCLRMVLMLVMCAPDACAELTQVFD